MIRAAWSALKMAWKMATCRHGPPFFFLRRSHNGPVALKRCLRCGKEWTS